MDASHPADAAEPHRLDPGRLPYAGLRAKTIPGLLLERARASPDRVAFRAKTLGIYREVTWREYADRVAALTLGLAALGLRPGQTAAIMGNPCPAWAYADMAVMAAGGISYGLYPTLSPGELRYLLQHGEAALFVAEDQEHLDKALAVLADCPSVRRLLVADTRALFMYRDERILPLAEAEARGRRALAEDAGAFERLLAQVKPSDPATIVYTSGTTANPKGVLYSHGRHLAACAAILDHYPELQGKNTTIAYLPLCHAMGRDVALTMPLLADMVPHYPEDQEAFAETLFEVAPTAFIAVPRYLQKMASHLLVGIETTAPLKRAAYRAAMAVGRAHLQRVWEGRPAPLLRAAYALARALVFRPLLDKVGFIRVRRALSAGAPLPPQVMALWQIWGLNLAEFYGQTEQGGACISGQLGPTPRPGDVGVPAPNMRVRLAEDGEVLVMGPDFFEGYWKDPAATAACHRDGWLLTGDVGEWTPAGALRLVDRKKDVLITAGGKNVSPAQVENALRASPYISEAAVFGDGRKYLVALVEIDYETVAEWARTRGVPYTGYTSLAHHAEVAGLIAAEVDRANAQLARVEQVKAFRILPKELDPEEEGEPITPTRKVKRRLMLQRFGDLVESMYGADEERRIAAEVQSLGGAR
jgi:long-chain acyl-CoA synthetase